MFCVNGILSELGLDVGMESFSINNERSSKDWDCLGGSLEGQYQLFRCEHGVKVLWVDTGIVAIPLFKIDIPLSSKCIGFCTKLPGPKLNYKVKSHEIFGPLCLPTCENLHC